MYPNSDLSAWQLALVAVVAMVTLIIWIGAVFLAAREPSRQDLAAAGSPGDPPTAGTGLRSPAKVAEREPERRPAERQAA